jgi:hypothetical protein
MNERTELAELWRKILQTDPETLFHSELGRLQNRSWGDRIAQPGYVGPNYRPGGVAFVSMNPGGGRGTGLGREDLLQYEALKQLRDCTDAEAAEKFEALTTILQQIMPTWTIIQRFVDPILLGSGIAFSLIAYFNLLKWRTSDSSNLKKLYEISWHHHTQEQVRILAPSVVIAIGVDAGNAFRRHHTELVHFDVIPRVIGNNIGEPGRQAIRQIGTWLSDHPEVGRTYG